MKNVGEILSIIAIVSNLTFLIFLEGIVERGAVVIFIAVLVLVYAQLRANRAADEMFEYLNESLDYFPEPEDE